MHTDVSDGLRLATDSNAASLDLTCTPHLKSSTPPERATTPRLRTSMSSHSRLLPDDSSNPDPTSFHSILPVDVSGHAPNVEMSTGGTILMDLPEELQQRILDYLMGELRSASAKSGDKDHALVNWNHRMRHPRGRRLASLSLVCPLWRRLIQERIYRHIKIQGTNEGLQECLEWFGSHAHLQAYVRHIEFWVPVWERRGGTRDIRDPSSSTPMDLALERDVGDVVARPEFIFVMTNAEPISNAYMLSSQKSSLDELFYTVDLMFPSSCVLTIEGGHCKKPPMIQQFRTEAPDSQLRPLRNIRTLVTRGAWNVMREESHMNTISRALPNLKEWHCSFTKPKSKAYKMMYQIVKHIPLTLTHLNLTLEGFYSKKTINSTKMQVIQRESHLCEVIGQLLPQLETLTLTGRVCSNIFTHGIEASKKVRRPRLKSLDIVVKNCCRGLDVWDGDGTGIHNWSFIAAFEQLVTTASRALKFYPDLDFLRIRFVDLDAPAPLLNPYFQLHNNELSGIWNEFMLKNLEAARPYARYADIAESIGMASKGWPGYPAQRPKSMRTSIYQAFVDGGSFF